MSRFKRLSLISCAMLLLVVCSVPPVCADDTGITPYMEHIALAQCSLDFNGTKANVNAWVQARNDATRTEVTVELQEQFLLFFWTTVDTWSSSSNNAYCRATGSTAVASGKTYRAVATVTAWVGSDSETQTITTESRVAE